MRWKLWIRKWHRWLAIVVGIQFLFWTVSGLYFSLVPIKTVRGEDRSFSEPQNLDLAAAGEILAPADLWSRYGSEEIREVRLQNGRRGLVYGFYAGGRFPKALVDARSGEPLPAIAEEDAVAAARADYGAEFQVEKAVLLDEAPADYHGPVPVFQVKVADKRATRLYISPLTGEVIQRRNRFWRIFDFLWMLHILDFQERENFNNNLLRVVASGSVVTVISGYALWVTSRRWRKRKRSVEPMA